MPDAAVLVTRPAYGQTVVERAAPWNPWRALRERDHILFRRHAVAAEMGGALYARKGQRAAIVIDPAMPRRERAAALAHELVHDERGGGQDFDDFPDTWDALVARDELQVHREVAARLVPLGDLLSFCQARAELGEGVQVHEVSEEFDVSESVASVALDLLRRN